MVLIQSIVCALLFIINLAWEGAHWAVGAVLNLLLAISCLALLIRVAAGRSGSQTQSDSQRDDFFNYEHRAVNTAIVASLIFLYFAASFTKLNGSSTALWRGLADRQAPDIGLVAGTAKEIRSDEWLVQTPWIWSQAEQTPSFPALNRNVGSGTAPLLTNLPVRHWTILFRPQMWGFFCLDRERAFAFNWNFKWFGLLLGGFLFFQIVARGNAALALGGALILLFSSYVQWFFSTPTCMPEMIAMLFFGLWALHSISQTRSKWKFVGVNVVLLVAIEQFVFCCYPRFQISLFYLAITLIIAGAIVRGRVTSDYFRGACLVVSLLVASVLVWQWYREVAPTIREIQGLEYPGRVFAARGGFPLSRLLAPFLEFSMTETNYPKILGNACEASGFIFLAPFLFVAVIRDASSRKADPVLIAIVIFLAFAICYLTIGISAWFAGVTGWSHVSFRAVLAIGVASIVGFVRHLTLPARPQRKQFSLLLGASVLACALSACLALTNSTLGSFASTSGVIAAGIFFATFFCVLWRRLAVACCILLIVPLFYSNAGVNPIGRGLPAFAHSAVFQWLADTHRHEPNACWMVIGNHGNRNCCMAQFLKATGATVLGGNTCTPDRGMLSALDPQNSYARVHNRYARVCFVAGNESGIRFQLRGPDYYEVILPNQPQIFEALKVRYILLVDLPETASIVGFKQIASKDGLALLQRD